MKNKIISVLLVLIIALGVGGLVYGVANQNKPEAIIPEDSEIVSETEVISSEIEEESLPEKVIEPESKEEKIEESSSEIEEKFTSSEVSSEVEETEEVYYWEPTDNDYAYSEPEWEPVYEEPVYEEPATEEPPVVETPITSELPVDAVTPTPYTEEDLDLLARIIYQEAGCMWLSDEHQLLVGAVVMNRVNSSMFPNTVHDVIYQPGQYGPAIYGTLYNATPDERTYANAEAILNGEFDCPDNILWQAGFVQGDGVYEAIYDETLGTTTYFCYSD